MKKTTIAIIAMLAPALPALAGGNHAGGHGHEQMAAGEAGDPAKANRDIDVSMQEKDDGSMVFDPASVSVKKGETIRFRITNTGELDHEFVLDEHGKMMEHKALMEKFPEMEHDDPNSVRLKQGETGEIVWKFTNAGEFEFACLIPGHYEAGMKGAVSVAAK